MVPCYSPLLWLSSIYVLLKRCLQSSRRSALQIDKYLDRCLTCSVSRSGQRCRHLFPDRDGCCSSPVSRAVSLGSCAVYRAKLQNFSKRTPVFCNGAITLATLRLDAIPASIFRKRYTPWTKKPPHHSQSPSW